MVHAAVYLASILLILKSDPTLYDDTRSAVGQVVSRIRRSTR
jgi:hypothetical protein